MSIERTTSANNTVTCLYSADCRRAGSPHHIVAELGGRAQLGVTRTARRHLVTSRWTRSGYSRSRAVSRLDDVVENVSQRSTWPGSPRGSAVRRRSTRRRAGRGIVDPLDARDGAPPSSVSETTLQRRLVGSVSRTTSPRSSRSLTATRGRGCVHGGGLGDLLGRHRPLGQPAQDANPAERQTGGARRRRASSCRGCRTPPRPWRARRRRRAGHRTSAATFGYRRRPRSAERAARPTATPAGCVEKKPSTMMTTPNPDAR